MSATGRLFWNERRRGQLIRHKYRTRNKLLATRRGLVLVFVCRSTRFYKFKGAGHSTQNRNRPSQMLSFTFRRSVGVSRSCSFSGRTSFGPGRPSAVTTSTRNSSGHRAPFGAVILSQTTIACKIFSQVNESNPSSHGRQSRACSLAVQNSLRLHRCRRNESPRACCCVQNSFAR